MLLNFALNNFTPSSGVSEVYFTGGFLTVINNCMDAKGSSTPYTTPFEVQIQNTLEISANPGGVMLGIDVATQTVNQGSSIQFNINNLDENAIPIPESITIDLYYDTFRIDGHPEGDSGNYTNPYGDLILKVSASGTSELLESIPLATDTNLTGLVDLRNQQIPITKWAEITRFDLEVIIKYVVSEA